jgi:hypothetical protein
LIDLGSIAGLYEHQQDLAAYCPHCERWRVLPLARLVANGQGSRRLPVRVRCVVPYGPPMPVLDPHRGGWIKKPGAWPGFMSR